MKYAALILFATLALVWAADANSTLMVKRYCATTACVNVRQLQNLKHARYVCHHGANRNKRWNCAAVKWLTREYKQTWAVMHPRVVAARHTLAQARALADACLSALIGRESGWIPNRWNSEAAER